MKKIIPIAIFVIALLSIKCSSNKNANLKIKNEFINNIVTRILNFPESGEDTLKVSYFADTVIYVPLETTPKSFIYNIEKLWMNDSVILISCTRAGLLMFQRDGKFVRKIGKNGRGPGEYSSIYNFDVILDTIYISSAGRRSFMRYTFDGTYCDEIQLKYVPVFFTHTADQKLACYLKTDGKVLVYNKNFHTPDTIVVEYGVTKGRYYYSFGDPTFMTYLQKKPSGLLFNDYMNDTVWNITNDKKEPAYILNMKNKLPRDKHIEFSKGDFNGWENTAKAFQLVHLMPFSSCMFIFQKHWLGSKYDAIYLDNTKTGEIKKYNTTFIYDDIVSNQKLSFVYFIYSADYLVADMEPLKVLKDLNKNKKNIKRGTSLLWLNQMKNVKENDNPILTIIKLKKSL